MKSDQIPDDGDRDYPRNVSSIRTSDVADSPRRFYRIYSPRKLRNLYWMKLFINY